MGCGCDKRRAKIRLLREKMRHGLRKKMANKIKPPLTNATTAGGRPLTAEKDETAGR